MDDLYKSKNVTEEKRRKTLASKKECYDKISAMEKASFLKHRRKLQLPVNKIKKQKLYLKDKLHLGLESTAKIEQITTKKLQKHLNFAK